MQKEWKGRYEQLPSVEWAFKTNKTWNPAGLSASANNAGSEFYTVRYLPVHCHGSTVETLQSRVACKVNYGQLFLKPLFHLNSIPFSLKQGQGLFIHHCSNNHYLLLIFGPNTISFTRTVQTLFYNSLG